MDLSPHFWWFVARSSGITSFGLLTISMWLGLGVTTRIFDGLFDRPWVYEVHRFSSLLALAFAGLHVVALLLDPYIGYNVATILLPGASPYRPLATAAGVLGLYLAAVVIGSFYVKQSLGHRTWRMIHYTSVGMFVLLLLHGLFAGTDSGSTWMKYTYWLAATGTTYLVVYRVVAAVAKAAGRRRPRVAVEPATPPALRQTASSR